MPLCAGNGEEKNVFFLCVLFLTPRAERARRAFGSRGRGGAEKRATRGGKEALKTKGASCDCIFFFFQSVALAHFSTSTFFFSLSQNKKNKKSKTSLAAVDSDATDAEVEDKLGFQLEALSKQVRNNC